MKVHVQKIVAMVLAVSLCLSMSAFATGELVPYVYKPEPSAAVELDNYWVSSIGSSFGGAVKSLSASLVFSRIGECDSRAQLEDVCRAYNDSGLEASIARMVDTGLVESVYRWMTGRGFHAEIKKDSINNIYRLRDSKSKKWLVNQNGDFPYCPADVFDATAGAGRGGAAGATQIYTESGTANKFVGVRSVDSKTPVIVSHDALSSACVSLNDQGIACTMLQMPINGVKFWVIYQRNSSDGSYYCNSANHPFVASCEPTVTDTKFDYIVNGDSTVDNSTTTIKDSQLIDVADGTLNLVNENGDKVTYNIDSLYYDFADRSYTVNTYDYTYNTTNNYYEYNYYTYKISYTYNNTYVTYIGSSAEYQPTEYKLYYELPDGRSSADLTAEDIAGLSFEFYDVVNYARSATDTSLRALYHFDGDTDDSSYFSTQTAFTWVKGASLSYMEDNSFGGALYLDAKEHEFTLSLPSNLGSGDFSLQWRYYQNAAITSEHNDNYVKFGSTKVLGWSEQNLYSYSGSETYNLYSLSVGSWQELALIRHDGVFYVYHNGLKIFSAGDTSVYSKEITFHFGPASRAYSMLDELRVVNFAVAKNGAAYTCASVPYDTNCVLVLPDGAFPIADEYWKFNSAGNYFSFYDFTVGENPSEVWSLPSPGNGSFYAYDGFSRVSSNEPYTFGFAYYFSKNASSYGGPVNACWFSVLGVDGTVYSLHIPYPRAGGGAVRASFDWGELIYYCGGERGNRSNYASISVSPGKTFDFIYAELVEGSAPNTGHEFVNCVYSSEEVKPNTAAVQSDIPVNGYTVGGVRPTFPSRGDVWFPVNGSRISGCYIYNGRAWEETNARWYTGTRWIPIYAFDLVTLQDMWDVADSETVVPSITSEYGFWNWWKTAWLDFRSWLSSSSGLGGGSAGSVAPGTFETVAPSTGTEGGSGWSFLDLLVAIKDGAWSITVGTVTTVFGGVAGLVSAVGSIGDYYNAYDTNNPDGIFGITNYAGDDIWD